HSPPSSAPRLNAVERSFSSRTRRPLQRATFSGVVDLQAPISRYTAQHNRRPKPFSSTKPASAIFDALSRAPEPSV
ncbi:IS630 family transposase, partial [Methylobacterium sp. J-078]|nr:IS630 family transposase [Methylobacterium sp. J-078]